MRYSIFVASSVSIYTHILRNGWTDGLMRSRRSVFPNAPPSGPSIVTPTIADTRLLAIPHHPISLLRVIEPPSVSFVAFGRRSVPLAFVRFISHGVRMGPPAATPLTHAPRGHGSPVIA